MAILAILNISKKYHLRFFSNLTHMFIMTEIWSVSISVLCFGIIWPQFQKWWKLGHFWVIFSLGNPPLLNFFHCFLKYFWTLLVYRNQFHTSKLGKKPNIFHQNGRIWPKMAWKWPLSTCTKVPLVGTLNLCQEMPDIMQKDLGRIAQPF